MILPITKVLVLDVFPAGRQRRVPRARYHAVLSFVLIHVRLHLLDPSNAGEIEKVTTGHCPVSASLETPSYFRQRRIPIWILLSGGWMLAGELCRLAKREDKLRDPNPLNTPALDPRVNI